MLTTATWRVEDRGSRIDWTFAILYLLSSILILSLVQPAAAQGLVVEPGGPTLAQAIAQARPGERIVVRPGVYKGPTVVVDKAVEIVGEGFPIFDGAASDGHIFLVTADSVTIRGLHFRNVPVSFIEDRAAVKVDEAHHFVLEGNRLEDTFFGFYLAKSAYGRVANNEIIASGTRETDSGNGIHLWYCKEIFIEGNTIRGHRDGIYLEFVEDSQILGNRSTENLRYGLHFMFSDRCAYRNNLFQDNDAGVAVMYTQHVEMTGNRFIHNWGPAAFGLLLKDITDSRIEDNVFRKNSVGIYAEGTNRTEVRRNEFIENGWAVKIMADAEDNLFTRNNFVGNSFDVATNSRQHYSTFAENYWDHYQGYDLDRDGYGDVPFRPVRLFSLMVEKNEPSLLLLRSFFIDLLDAAERVIPSLTPETLVDEKPLMRRIS